MSEQYEVKDSGGKVYKAATSQFGWLGENLYLSTFWSYLELNDTFSVRQGGSEWHTLTRAVQEKIINPSDNSPKGLRASALAQKSEEEALRIREAEALQKKEALYNIHQLKAKCASGEWSLDDLQSIFQLVSQIPTTPQSMQEHDELSLAQNDLINDVCKNPSLSEPLKIMYSNAQLGMQQQILNNLANGNSILQQSQKSRNSIGAAGMFVTNKVLSELGDINDALGGDE